MRVSSNNFSYDLKLQMRKLAEHQLHAPEGDLPVECCRVSDLRRPYGRAATAYWALNG